MLSRLAHRARDLAFILGPMALAVLFVAGRRWAA
jgi:hypothetical protein